MSSWPLIPLSDLAQVERDIISPENIRGGVTYVGLENIETGGALIDVSMVKKGELKSAKFAFSNAHILYGKLRPYLAKIALPSFPGICSTDILPVLPGLRLDRRYLAYFLRQPEMVELATARSTGANLPRLSPSELARFLVPLAPLEEQRRIAAILDQADALRRKRQQTVDRLAELSEAIFYEMFVKNERKEWPIRQVADLAADIRTGPFGSQLLHSEFVEEGIAVLGIDNAVSNEFRWDQRRFIAPEKYIALRRYTVRPGDVLITIMGTCGRCAIVPEDIPTAINTKHLCCITLDRAKALPAFLHASFLQQPSVLKQLGVQAKGAVMPGLNMGIVKSLELRTPPLDLQEAFVWRMEALRDLRASCREHRDQLDDLFVSLQHRAFRGELTSGDVTRELEMAG